MRSPLLHLCSLWRWSQTLGHPPTPQNAQHPGNPPASWQDHRFCFQLKKSTSTFTARLCRGGGGGATRFLPTEDLTNAVAVLGDFVQPAFHVHKRFRVGHVVNDDDAVRVSVVPETEGRQPVSRERRRAAPRPGGSAGSYVDVMVLNRS